MRNPSAFTSVLHALNLSAALSFASAALAGAESAPSPREIIPLDNGWRFHLGDDPAARRPDFDDTSWYRKSFTLPPTASKKVVIEFDGVYMNSEVWINGQLLGRRPYGFIGFRYDLTQFLKTNSSPNLLAVRVDDSAEPSLRWYAGSGIYRHVRLIATSYTHFRLGGGINITTPEVSSEQATVQTSYTIDAHFFTDEERLAWAKDVWK